VSWRIPGPAGDVRPPGHISFDPVSPTAIRIREILLEILQDPIEGEDPLAEAELDSLALEQLVDHLETEFGVELENEDLTPERLGDLTALAALVDDRAAA